MASFSFLLSISCLQPKFPAISRRHFAFSWAIFPWWIVYPGICPETHKSNYSREVNKALWESITLLNRHQVISALSQVQGSYLGPTLWCGQESLLLWTHTSESSLLLFSGHALLLWPKGHTNLELITVSLPNDTPGTKNSGVSSLNDTELSSRACTGLFSGSGPTVNRTARIPTPGPVGGHGQLLRRWWKADGAYMCPHTRCPHVPCSTRPPQYSMKLVVKKEEG